MQLLTHNIATLMATQAAIAQQLQQQAERLSRIEKENQELKTRLREVILLLKARLF